MGKLISIEEFTRGDTIYLARRVTDLEGNVLIINPETDLINFTMRKDIDSDVAVHKDLSDGITINEDGVIEITIPPKDTEKLDFGKYGFDIEITIGKDEEVPFVRTPNSGTIELLEDDYSRPIKVGE